MEKSFLEYKSTEHLRFKPYEQTYVHLFRQYKAVLNKQLSIFNKQKFRFVKVLQPPWISTVYFIGKNLIKHQGSYLFKG